ncbi:aminoglycoside phosphotransferase family protein [Actinomycetospora atypica]|uniref:Aminoglycoside phosphotransferase family protein n=1 Tax=Actinomycetospora atypica TaxID=1290095 RepID=A0ABV9YJ16_9PSEU
MIEVPDEARRRLVVRFGPGATDWLDELPALVGTLARRWGLQIDGPVLSGNSAIVLPADRGVLKLHPDGGIAADEAAALAHWSAASTVVDLLEHDEGALLLARVRPGTAVPTALGTDPAVLPALVDLWTTPGAPDVPPLVDRVAFWHEKVREHLDDERVRGVIPPEVLDRGAGEAEVLAARPGHEGLVHGDLHAGNLLTGPAGAVVVDPRPCRGDRTFDLVDPVLVEGRPERVVPELARRLDGLDPDLLHAWCRALAPANAIAALRTDPGSARTAALVALALRD